MSEIINIDDYTGTGAEGAIELAAAVIRAAYRATGDGLVTYLYSSSKPVACVSPVEAGERYEHANEVMTAPRQREETVPVLVRTEPRHRRRSRPWWTRGPFEGVF
jgi:hypothetical protein